MCVFLFGGNDCNNTVVPISTPASNANNSYAKYAAVRGGLALPQTSLNSINTSKGDEYGLHPGLVELANLYNTKKNVAVLTNVGSLVTPLTQSDYLETVQSHPAKFVFASGSANRIADVDGAGLCDHRLGRAAGGCHAGLQHLLASPRSSRSAAMRCSRRAPRPTRRRSRQDRFSGLQGFATNAASQARLTALQNLLSFDNGLTLVQASNAIASNGVNQATALNQALAGGTALTTVFPNTSLGKQMAQIAKIINVRASLGVNRQIFFAYLGGFDTHDLELNDQGTGLAARQPGAECVLQRHRRDGREPECGDVH